MKKLKADQLPPMAMPRLQTRRGETLSQTLPHQVMGFMQKNTGGLQTSPTHLAKTLFTGVSIAVLFASFIAGVTPKGQMNPNVVAAFRMAAAAVDSVKAGAEHTLTRKNIDRAVNQSISGFAMTFMRGPK